MKDLKSVFRAYDVVYDYRHGWGIIHYIAYNNLVPIAVRFNGENFLRHYHFDGSRKCGDKVIALSFTEYSTFDESISHERPKYNIEGYRDYKSAVKKLESLIK